MQEKTVIKMFSMGQASDDMSSEEKLLYALGIASREFLPVTLDVKFTKEIFCAAFIIMDGDIIKLCCLFRSKVLGTVRKLYYSSLCKA